MAYDNTNSGTISKNANKTTDKHPDIKGSLNVDGTDYWISGWLKKNSRDGSSFYSLSVQPKELETRKERAPARNRDDPRTSYGDRADDLDGDSIPF